MLIKACTVGTYVALNDRKNCNGSAPKWSVRPTTWRTWRKAIKTRIDRLSPGADLKHRNPGWCLSLQCKLRWTLCYSGLETSASLTVCLRPSVVNRIQTDRRTEIMSVGRQNLKTTKITLSELTHSLPGATTHAGSWPTQEVTSNHLYPWPCFSNFWLPASLHPSSLHPSI